MPADIIHDDPFSDYIERGLAFEQSYGSGGGDALKAKEAIARGRCGLIVAASDGSPAERARLGGGDIPVATGLTAVEMGEAFGREHAVHAAIASGNLAERLREDLARLAAYRAVGGNE